MHVYAKGCSLNPYLCVACIFCNLLLGRRINGRLCVVERPTGGAVDVLDVAIFVDDQGKSMHLPVAVDISHCAVQLPQAILDAMKLK
jgi:hypothetical protein